MRVYYKCRNIFKKEEEVEEENKMHSNQAKFSTITKKRLKF